MNNLFTKDLKSAGKELDEEFQQRNQIIIEKS